MADSLPRGLRCWKKMRGPKSIALAWVPEALRTYLARLRPGDLGFTSGDEGTGSFSASRCLLKVSGTQNLQYHVSFQWTTREALRRAPATYLVGTLRTAPTPTTDERDVRRDPRRGAELDPVGSLVDADMAAYYNWLNQRAAAWRR